MALIPITRRAQVRFDLDTEIDAVASNTISAAIGDSIQGYSATLDAVVDNVTVTGPVDLDALAAGVAASTAAVVLKGTWDASTGSFPGAGAALAGWSYIVSVGGTVDSEVFTANDRIIAITDSASTTTYAGNWHKADYTDLVSSVAGKTGAVTLTSSDLTDVTAFAQTLLDDANAAAARTTLDVDVAGTDNSTNVTLAGSLDYLTLSGQQITRNAIDLATDVTGALPAASVSIADTGTLITATTVEGALAENRAAIDAIEADYLQASDISTALFDADIGVNVQAYAANLTEWAGINPSANGGSLVAAANYAAMRGLLDLEAGTDFYSISATDSAIASAVVNMLETGDIGSIVQAYDAQLDEWSSVDPSVNGKSLVSAANYAAMRSLLGLDVRHETGTTTVAEGEHLILGNTSPISITIASGATWCQVSRATGSTEDVTVVSADAPTVTVAGDATGGVINQAVGPVTFALVSGDYKVVLPT